VLIVVTIRDLILNPMNLEDISPIGAHGLKQNPVLEVLKAA